MLKRSVRILVFVGLALGGAALWAKAVDVTGDWEMTLQSPQGERTMKVSFIQTGESLEVKAEGFQGEEIKGTGKIKDNEIEWTFAISSPQGEMSIVHKGKVDGDTMSGAVSLGEMGTADWTAKRIKK
jgi:hypothetical protein